MSETELQPEEKTIPFFPDHIRTEAWVTAGILALAVLVGILGMITPVGLEPPADPMDTPTHVKPEWYFLFLYQMLKYVPKTLGVLIPIVGIIILMLWPFLDRGPDSPRAVRFRWILTAVLMALIIALTILGALS